MSGSLICLVANRIPRMKTRHSGTSHFDLITVCHVVVLKILCVEGAGDECLCFLVIYFCVQQIVYSMHSGCQ